MANEEVKKRNLKRVLNTAYQQFMCHGIDNTTQQMLVIGSGISRASIDRYFVNKADCVVQTAEMMAERVNEYLKEKLSDDFSEHNGLEMLEIFLNIVKQLYIKNPKMFLLVAEMKVYIYHNYPDSSLIYQRIYSTLGYREMVKKIFFKGIEDKSIRPDITVDNETLYVSDFYRELLVNLSLSTNPISERVIESIDNYIEKMLWIYKNR